MTVNTQRLSAISWK